MILADKIIDLRKKNGWSQEELAEKLGVSRQAVSKWEGAQSVPDLNKILQMSALFGVSTDYLLKDNVEKVEFAEDDESDIRKVSMAEANEYIGIKEKYSFKLAFATFLCILSPVVLFITAGMAEAGKISITEDAAGGIGMVIMFVLIAIATAIFIYCGNQTSKYQFLDKEVVEPEYGVVGMVKERKAAYKSTYDRSNIIGTILCILAVTPLFATAFLDNDFVSIISLGVMFVVVGIGVMFFVKAGTIWSSFNRLTQEEDYSVDKKKDVNKNSALSTIFWLIATAIYLGWSFATNEWHRTWLVWPVAGVLYAALEAGYNAFRKK